MKKTNVKKSVIPVFLSLSVLSAATAFAQSRLSGGFQHDPPIDDTSRNGAVASALNLIVSKTAHVSGQDVCGVIRITNLGMGPATIAGIADALEVRFQSNIPPYPMPAGSTPNWFKIADVPISVPGPIAPRKTATINYCFSLCQAADYPGAASMRNAVRVSVANPPGAPRIFPALSNTFAPPILDCQACCLPDGSCLDTLPAQCSNAGGLARGTGTDCATTECPEACCHPDDSCTDDPPSVCQTASGEPKGAGTDCATTQCCEPPGSVCTSGLDCCGENAICDDSTCCVRLAEIGCEDSSDCCEDDGTAICDAGRCCAPNRAQDSCHDASDCCDQNAACSSRTCCLPLGKSGCTNLVGNDCCDGIGAVSCVAGKCCAPTGAEDSCSVDSDCCDSGATCNGGTCCVRFAESGCEDSSDCCEEDGTVICDEGKCCAPNRSEDSCHDALDCCDENATCSNRTCCIALGDTGCTNLVGNDCCDGIGAVSCVAGKCCAPTGAEDSCSVDSDCCDPGATCNGGTCCVGTGDYGCEDVSDCCDDRSGMACLDDKCCVGTDAAFHSACNVDSDCCNANATCNIHRACCIATGTSGCAGDSHCCDGSSVCAAGKCCAPTGAANSCSVAADCCNNSAICENSECCLSMFRSCTGDSDCCSGLFCDGGSCMGVAEP